MKTKNHGNGFIRVYLSDDHLLHFYSTDIPRQAVLTETHDHRFSYESEVLEGLLTQETFEETPGSDFDVYTDAGDDLVFTGRSCSLKRVDRIEVPAGQRYFLVAGTIHRISHTGATVTEVHRARHEDYSAQVRIFVPHGLVPDNEFDNGVKGG